LDGALAENPTIAPRMELGIIYERTTYQHSNNEALQDLLT